MIRFGIHTPEGVKGLGGIVNALGEDIDNVVDAARAAGRAGDAIVDATVGRGVDWLNGYLRRPLRR